MEKEIGENFKVFFSDAGCPGQRGSCEKNNSIIRKYLHKSTILNKYSQKQLDKLSEKINKISRKSLSYKTSNEVLYELTNKISVAYRYI